MDQFKTYLFSYQFEGVEYSLEVPACSIAEAKGRVSRMCFAKYDGELMCKIPAVAGASVLVRTLTWLKNITKV